MSERDFQNLARGMRNTGSVRLFTSDLEPRTPMNTSAGDIMHMIAWTVFEENPDLFRKDDRSEKRMEIRYHWVNLTEKDKETILRLCSEKIEQNDIVNERNLQVHVFDQIYRYLNTQAT